MARERSYLVFDLETVPDPDLPSPVASETHTLPAPPHHRVAVIGVLWLDAARRVKRLGVVAEKSEDEAVLLSDFVRFIEDHRPELVSWNGRGFDMPVIAARCLRHGIPFPHYYNGKGLRYRYSAEGHLDLMDFINDFGASKSAKLDVVAKMIGMPGKVGVDGKDVAPLFLAGRLADIQAYCLSDVVQTAAIFLRVELVRGELSREAYLEAMQSLLAAIEADPRTASILQEIVRKRLLFES